MEAYQQLEREWAEFNGLDPAGMVACSSGTAALHLALEAFQLPQGSKVIVPDFNMIAVPRAVTLAGLEPVFVDCGDDLNIDSKLRINCGIVQMPAPNDIKCIIAVHIYGRRVDMNSWMSSPISAKVIEDIAEAHGIRPHPHTDAACWSFYKNKIVAGEEGGAVWFRDPKHATLARQLRSLGFTEAHDFDHVPRGHNYRMSNMHAREIYDMREHNKYGLWNYDEVVVKRREIETFYNKHCPRSWKMLSRDAPWVYDLRIPGLLRQKQAEIVKALNEVGIAARMSFKPMHMQREYGHEGLKCRLVSTEAGCYVKSWVAANEVFYLPLMPGTMDEAKCRLAFEVIGRLAPP